MRLQPEKLNIKETLAIHPIEKMLTEVKIVTDSVVPLSPQREEREVLMQTSVQQKEGEEPESQQGAHAEQENGNDQNAAAGIAEDGAPIEQVTSMPPPVETALPRQQVSPPITVESEYGDVISALPLPATEYALYTDSIVTVDSLAQLEAVVAPKGMSSYSLANQKEGNILPPTLDRSDGIFALLLLFFLFLAHAYNGGFTFFRENIMLVFSSSKGDKLETQRTTKEIVYSYILLWLAIFLISISLYEALNRYMPQPENSKQPFVTIGLFMLLMLVFILIKITINRLTGYIFDIGKRITAWNQSFIILLSMLGLLCFFPVLMLVYSNLWHQAILGFVLILFLVAQIILFIRIIIFFLDERYNILYLIAYLCTVEILPYIFLGIGLVYLYRIDFF